ncbi:uncharacterized protein LOC133460159 [Cololabis saira]|uniref:uncharacterized protein LOC133460159 n=1 Tax=Cololabis saira TaxID=129043 RepID=UPI002AD44347|nr:uncharacterized protein LOC133460159 [Cololabis saira]
MNFLQRHLNVFLTLSLLSSPTPVQMQGPRLSLWGQVADFTAGCSHWSLKPQVSIPALQELTVCLNLKLEIPISSKWTIFMYRHPTHRYPELGLGGKWGHLVVWLFGMEWISPQMNLQLSRWYPLCLTWSHTGRKPVLYVDGRPTDIVAAHNTDSVPPSCKLSPNGSLTLGADHTLVSGTIHIIPSSGMMGKLSLFRIWGRERSKQEVTSRNCSEGDLVMWEEDVWDTYWLCYPRPDLSLKCEWSCYEVTLLFDISRYDGNNSELYIARDIAHRWLRKVLPGTIYLHRVSVFEEMSSGLEIKTPAENRLVRWVVPSVNRFHCLVHISVYPKMNVADAQEEIHKDLQIPLREPSGLLRLSAVTSSIHTTPVDNFPAPTVSPTVATGSNLSTTSTLAPASPSTPSPTSSRQTSTSGESGGISTTSPANISDLYFQVKVNVSLRGVCDPQQILPAWLNIVLPADMMIVLDLQLPPQTERRLPYTWHDPATTSEAFGTSHRVSRYGSFYSHTIQPDEKPVTVKLNVYV